MNPVESAAALLGRRGGSVGSPAQKAAARENGKLGGRPRSKAKRCECGAMTLKRAKARGHQCPATMG
jgi:hypothetical protein